jgi:hypothetical protein
MKATAWIGAMRAWPQSVRAEAGSTVERLLFPGCVKPL